MSLTGLDLLAEAWGEVSWIHPGHLPYPLTVGLHAGYADIHNKGS